MARRGNEDGDQVSGTAARRPQGWWLASGSAPVVGLAIMALLGAGWLAAIALGGAGHIAPHWFYLPVMLAGLRFGLRGAALTGVAASIVAGPLLPADVATWTGQAPSDWVSRGIFFIAIGLVVARLFTLLRRSSTAELRAAELELTIRPMSISGPWSNAPATWLPSWTYTGGSPSPAAPSRPSSARPPGS